MIDFAVEEEKTQSKGACIKVIGVGGGGGNAINAMSQGDDMKMVEFLIANTDAQSLDMSQVVNKIQLGDKITKGLGAGSNPDVGRRAAEEDIENLMAHIKGADILFLTAGMGGGTGSGGAPVIAQAAREMGILTVAVVTKPFMFEGRRRMKHAQDAINTLRQSVDTLLVVPNQKLLEQVDPKISMLDAFNLSNNVLKQAIKGISDIITKPGHMNVDFADVRSIMKDMGMALMGIGRVAGENRAQEAAMKAISSPLLEDISIEGARGVLINITGNTDLGLHEINEAANVIYELVSEDANIILGSVIDQDMGDELMVTVIATGFDSDRNEQEAGNAAPTGTPFGHGPTATPQSSGFNAHASQQQAMYNYAHNRFASSTPFTSSQQQSQQAQQAPQESAQAAPAQAAPAQESQAQAAAPQASRQGESIKSSFDMRDIDTPTFLRKNGHDD